MNLQVLKLSGSEKKNHFWNHVRLLTHSLPLFRGRGGKVSTSGPEGSRFQTRFHRITAAEAGLVHVKSAGAKCPPAGVVRKFGEGMPAQMTSSSPDHAIKISRSVPK
ncbi:hypothetical protein AVEN_102986-1 [Araneus ventricosus]|uniref:Uncharacterized protein n=1 Tax=Araneus ventricosus TaxID=182803 RepID=A0A4Y2B7E6_ARAVE|nr:hypothetical protein AVEN_102986-1 [Araneus ventricosus]